MKKWYFWGRRRVSCVWTRFLGIYIPRVDFGPEISCPTKLAGRQVGCASKLASRQLLTAFFSCFAGGSPGSFACEPGGSPAMSLLCAVLVKRP